MSIKHWAGSDGGEIRATADVSCDVWILHLRYVLIFSPLNPVFLLEIARAHSRFVVMSPPGLALPVVACPRKNVDITETRKLIGRQHVRQA